MDPMEVRSARVMSSESSVSDTSDSSDQHTTDSLISVNVTHNNLYIYRFKTVFLIAAALTMVGGYYNALFQGFVQDQLLEYMGFTHHQYQTIVTVPHIPNIILPIFAGPLIDIIGIRKGFFLFETLILIGMALILISTAGNVFAVFLIGKILLQIGTENSQLSQSTLVSKWFKYSSIAFALALCSFAVKVSSSLSGVGYPYLYDSTGGMVIPFVIGFVLCVLSMLATCISIYMDKKSESFDAPQTILENQRSLKKKNAFSFDQIKQFGLLYWLFVVKIFVLWGTLFGLQSYGQAVLIHKFSFDKIEASSSLAVIFFSGLSTPLFGMLSDRFGNRSQVIIGAAALSCISILLILVAPSESVETPTSKVLVYFFLFLFGTSISFGNAYIFPSIPLIVNSSNVGTAFGICYASRNLGNFFFSLIGGYIIGSNGEGYNQFILFFFLFNLFLLGITVLSLVVDKKLGLLHMPKIISNQKESMPPAAAAN